MHICFISHEYPLWGGGGGVGSFIQTLGRQLVGRGHQVSVVGVVDIKSEEVVDDQGVTIYRLPRSRRSRFRFYGNAKTLNRKLSGIHAQQPIDILEASELGLAFIDRRLPFKKVIRLHGGHHYFAVTLGKKPAPWRSWQEMRSFKKADHLIAVSNFVGKTTMSLLNTPDRKFTTIYNPIDMEAFHEASPEKVEQGNLLFVGTVCEKKGVRQLIQAIPHVKQKHPKVVLNIVGRDWFDPKTGDSYIEDLKQRFSENELNNVNFVGPVGHGEIPGYLERAQICVFPSHMESFGIMVIEAMAVSKPVIFSNTGPGEELITHKKTGMLSDPHSPQDIAEKISYMLAHPDEANEMGKSARRDVLERFSIDKLVDENVEFYRSCL